MTRFTWIILLLGCGGPVAQTEACAEYVSCIEARDAALGVSTNLDRFLEGGDCWGGEEGAALCDRACVNGLDWMRSAIDDLPEVCQP